MNTRKQVLIMSALMMVSLIIVGIYAAWYPGRAKDSSEHFTEATQERGAITFSLNCRLCHGDVGEGGALAGRLTAAPALDRPDLQGFADSKETLTSAVDASARTIAVSNGGKFKGGSIIIVDAERMSVVAVNGNNLDVERGIPHTVAASHSSGANIQLFDAAVLADKVKLITNTITCGRVGTAMPTWGQSQGGPLSDEQIRQLMVVITTGSWDVVHEEDELHDKLATKLLDPLSDSATTIHVSDVSVFTVDNYIRMSDERMQVKNVPNYKDAKGNPMKDRSGNITVRRGVLGTTPLEHPVEESIFTYSGPVNDPAITGANGAVCGQFPPVKAPSLPPTIIPDPFDGQTVDISATGVKFNTSTITVKTGGNVRIRFKNNDQGTDHNVAIYKSSTDKTPVAPGSVSTVFPGVNENDFSFAIPAAGSYYFQCDVHPTTMSGTFTVTN